MPEPAAGDPAPAPGSAVHLPAAAAARLRFRRRRELADYLAELGVTHVYLSPILQATPGSPHGYDVVDHSRVSAELGGEDAFRAMAARFPPSPRGGGRRRAQPHGAGPRLSHATAAVVGAVPGPGLAVRALVRRRLGRAGRPMLLPILGGPLEKCLDDLIIDTAPRTPEHDEHRGPCCATSTTCCRCGTASPTCRWACCWPSSTTGWPAGGRGHAAELAAVLRHRHADRDPGRGPRRVRRHSRRAARPGRRGLIDGLRVDHPDGLADPAGYLRRLAAATGGAWVVVEKILAGDEELPAWDCAGTTGYDALALVGGLFVDPAGGPPLTEDYVRFTGGSRTSPRSRATPSAARRRHARRGAVPAGPAVRPGRLPGPGRLQRGRPARRPGRAAGRVRRVPGLRDAGRAAARASVAEVQAAAAAAREPLDPGCTRRWTRCARRCSAWAARRATRRSGRPRRAGRAVRPDRDRCWPRGSRTPRSTAGPGWSPERGGR